MAGLATIYHALRPIADPTVDEALVAALPTARGRSLRVIALTLLERHHQPGLLGLILHYHRLPPDAQRHMIAHAGDLFRPLREASAMRDTAGPANAIHIIQAALSTRLAYLVTEHLRHGTDALKQQAAQCLLYMAQRAATAPSSVHHAVALPAIDAAAAEYLQTAVHDAVAAFGQHRQDDVLRALSWLLPRPMPDGLARLEDPQHPASPVMQSLLRRADDAAVRRVLLLMLGLPQQADAAVDGLRQCTATGHLGEALPCFHLLSREPARAALAKVKAAETLWPDARAIREMNPHERRGLPAYLMALPFDAATHIARLLPLRESHDTPLRLFALRRLLHLADQPGSPTARVDDAVAEFCHDADAAIARIALWHLIRRQYPDLPRILARLINSRHEQIRRIAGQRLAPIGFARLWETWPRLDTPRRLAAGRALMKIDPNFHRMLGDRLAIDDRKSRVRALAIITQLNQGALFHEALIQLAQADDHHVASAAVRALGSASDAQATVIPTLESALEHEDGRVRANAIEALAQLQSTRHVEQLVQLADDPQSRPRASAIAALMDLRAGDAVHSLRQMLDDPRPSHRHSALWLIQTVGLLELARHVAEVSLTDSDQGVRQRAAGVVRELIELMETPVPATVSEVAEVAT